MRAQIASLLVGESLLLGGIAAFDWRPAAILAGAQLIGFGLFRDGGDA